MKDETIKEVVLQMYNLVSAVCDAKQAIEEFNATYLAIKNRYHPVIWFIAQIFL